MVIQRRSDVTADDPGDVCIKTPHLVIREFEPDDWQALHAFMSLPEVSEYRPNDVMNEHAAREFIRSAIAHRKADKRGRWHLAITLKTGELIGMVALGVVSEDTGGLGYALHPSYWNHGYTTETVATILQFGFETLDLHRIRAHCHIDNIASTRVMEKCGMRREGTHLEHTLKNGQWMDIHVYAILQREYAK